MLPQLLVGDSDPLSAATEEECPLKSPSVFIQSIPPEPFKDELSGLVLCV